MADQDSSIVVTATAPEVTATTSTPTPDVTPATPPAHTSLASNSGSVLDYIKTELDKHKELLTIVDGMKTNLDKLHSELNEAGDKILTKVETPLSHKIIVGVVGLIALAIVVKVFI